MDPQYYAPRTHDKMKEVLKNPNASGPDVHYHMIRGGKDKTNVTVWQTGTIDGEYIKTYGHYHVGDLDETYWIVAGEGVALLQRRVKDAQGNPIDDEIDDFKAMKVKAGDSIYMPKEYGHLFVNTGKAYMVSVDTSPVNFGDKKDEASMPGHADYLAVQKMQGFAYYVVEKDGQPVLERNPRYKEVPEATITETAK